MPDTNPYTPPDCAPDCPVNGFDSYPDPLKPEYVYIKDGAAVLSWDKVCSKCPGREIHNLVDTGGNDILLVPIKQD